MQRLFQLFRNGFQEDSMSFYIFELSVCFTYTQFLHLKFKRPTWVLLPVWLSSVRMVQLHYNGFHLFY